MLRWPRNTSQNEKKVLLKRETLPVIVFMAINLNIDGTCRSTSIMKSAWKSFLKSSIWFFNNFTILEFYNSLIISYILLRNYTFRNDYNLIEKVEKLFVFYFLVTRLFPDQNGDNNIFNLLADSLRGNYFLT